MRTNSETQVEVYRKLCGLCFSIIALKHSLGHMPMKQTSTLRIVVRHITEIFDKPFVHFTVTPELKNKEYMPIT